MWNTESFVAKAKVVHGDRYDYAQTVYETSTIPVVIGCRLHGPFRQIPYNHIIGKGCGSCAGNKRKTAEELISTFRKIHGDRYVYDLAVFTSTKKRLHVTCPFHGVFTVSYHRHLKGAGCPNCTGRYNNKAARYFVERARAVHGNKYRYGGYESSPAKIEITCPSHGIFRQAAATHLRGHGCAQCAHERKRLFAKGGYSNEFFRLHPEMIERKAIIYLIEFTRAGESFVKLGITRASVASRMKSGYRQYGWRIIASRNLTLYAAFCLEQGLLTIFKGVQVFPKEHTFVGKTECLRSSCVGEVVKWIKDIDIAAMTISPILSA